jgi:diguanylate cyclase (GGDEF)-like protein/PAS domain S-box-containing protein
LARFGIDCRMSISAVLKVDGSRPAPLRILMVEDDPNDAELLQAHLAAIRPGGAQVLHARSLAEGLTLLQSQDVQITLLDLDLPDSQGLHTLERVRAAATGPVIVVSGNGHPSLVDEVLKRRAYDVIPKHELDVSTLQRVLRLATRHHESGREHGATEGRYRALLESSSEALVLLDAKGRIQYASAAMRRVLGYNSAEILGRSGLSFVLPGDREAVQKTFVALSAEPGSFATQRVRFQHRNGGLRVLESTLANRLGDAEVAAIVCSYRDVTQEDEHRERFSAMFENSPLGLAHVDLEGRFQIVNLRLCAMLGYTPEELVGRSVRELSHAEDVDAATALQRQLRAGTIPQFTLRKRYLRKDGETLWVQLTVSLERDAQGRPKYDMAAFEDVSESVRAEERLRASESRLRAIVGAEPECVKLLDGEGTLLEINPAGLAMIEAESLEVVAGQCVYALIAPAYRQRFKDLTDRVCRGERGTLEFEIVGLRGARRWLETHAVPLRDEATGKNLLLGITRDITAHKRAEFAAERLRRMYAALSSANEAIFKLDDEMTLYRRICELLVEHGGLKLAAVRLVDRTTSWIEPVAHAGGPGAYLERLRVSVDRERLESRGPAGVSALEGRTMVNNDILADPALALWHDVAREIEIAAVMSVPLRRAGEVVGVITLYSSELDWFDPELVGLAERMAQNISFALDNIDHERQRASAQNAVRSSEQRFRSLVALSSDFYWETDAAHRISVREEGGRSSAMPTFPGGAGIGKCRWELPFLSPDMRGWMAHKAVLDAHLPFQDFELSRPVPDGGARHFSISGEPVFDEQGEFRGYRGVGTDITVRKSALLMLELEHAVNRRLAEAESALDGVQAVIRSMCELHNWDHGRFWQVDDEADVMRFAALWSKAGRGAEVLEPALREVTFKPGQGIAGRVWQSGEPTWVADASTDPRTAKHALWRTPLRGTFMFPVRAAGRTLGVLTFASSEIRRPDERLLAAAGDIGNQIGQFLQRKRSEEDLRRFRAGMEASGDMILLVDHKSMRYVDVNETVCRTLGYTREEMLAMGPHDLVPVSRDELQRSYEKFVADPAAIHGMNSVYRCKDGSTIPFESSRRVLRSENGAVIVAISRDIRPRLQAEQALRESEARFRSLTELSADWYWEQDAELRFVSTAGHDLARGGITAAQHDGLRRWELPGTEPLEGSWDGHKAQLEARRPFRDFMLRRSGGDGKLHYVNVSGEPIFHEDGTFRGYRGVAKDVTQSMEAVVALRESEERFRSLTALSSDWYWEQDTEFRITVLSGRGAAALANGEAANYLGKTHWDTPDLEPVDGSWDAHRAMLERHEPFQDVVLRRRLIDGRDAYMSVSGEPVFDAQGIFTGYRGVAKNVTESVRAERHMRVHGARQAAVARFGQFALGRRQVEELYAEAARALRCEGVDAACVMEMFTAQGEFLVRAAQGDGPHAMLGLRAPLAPDSVWPEILRANTPRIAGRKYLSSRPFDRPWHAWVQTMGSAMYVPVHDDEKPIAMLCVYALAEHAFSTEDLRFAEAVGHVLSTALQRQRAEQRLAHLAQFDALTGLPNRTLLQDRLAQTIVQSRRKRWHAGALFVDLDRFKLINDTLGHHLGDVLIRQVGERLLECVRPGDTVGRISGDEFAVVLADMARPDDAALVAQKILDAMGRPFDLGGNEAYISASIGIAAFPEDGNDAETLLKNADIAMYRAKESARNCYRFFTAEMNQRTIAKVQLNTALRRAIEREEFTLHYQPKVDLADGRLRGLEALLRWNHPERGMVAPGEFIPALEDSGLILPVGEWVIGEACAQLRRWRSEGRAVVPVAVNLSPKQFRRGDLDRTIRELLARHDLNADLLELEITESCLAEDPEAALRVMHNLRAAGLRISIDDFGTGYSSLSHLTRLPLSALKIDRSFVRDAGASAEAASIVRAVIDMAQNLRFTVIAEGVETEQQVAFLRKHGCNQAQGYFFGRPNSARVVGEDLPRA